jgi:hypothetical protein
MGNCASSGVLTRIASSARARPSAAIRRELHRHPCGIARPLAADWAFDHCCMGKRQGAQLPNSPGRRQDLRHCYCRNPCRPLYKISMPKNRTRRKPPTRKTVRQVLPPRAKARPRGSKGQRRASRAICLAAHGELPQWTTAEIVEAFRRFAAANPTTRGERQPSCSRATRRGGLRPILPSCLIY